MDNTLVVTADNCHDLNGVQQQPRSGAAARPNAPLLPILTTGGGLFQLRKYKWKLVQNRSSMDVLSNFQKWIDIS